ncbi:hypothetical protein A3D70_00490 [Candidatus Adlerbacteria bacterium RIFCSPHIGHO2_02_FULL_54_18]|uniref:Uncharacterized protein n=2 Tax=Candidatus Adleribacteriota TaxID=1752736 RepID=A0A1F4Y1E4_9BACT|nr:MAG: hypothetical protein A2949_02750 [Candidatus Adlerbacteria bacterium RIFCSPLOWO2_01_FULL_54_21b]OGC87759.1 MAG: hypothetical protein A3D70_00490 [Candidatus Adlerbacteria bacterium RIFCSPHIGHO2_02_FULL_54_18]
MTEKTGELTHWITIVQTPQGEEPEWVRCLWVGVSLRCLSTGKGAYAVPRAEALAKLASKSPDAAEWYEQYDEREKFYFITEEVKDITATLVSTAEA